MAMRVSKSIVGTDVAKIELVTFQADLDLLIPIPNEKSAIKRWLKTLPRATAIAVEATNVYHVDLVELLLSMVLTSTSLTVSSSATTEKVSVVAVKQMPAMLAFLLVF